MISRQAPLCCPNCEIRLIRRRDKYFFGVCISWCILLLALPFLRFAGLSSAMWWAIAVPAAVLLVVGDAMTVRLAQLKE